jgi:hypothetical protein
MLTEVQNGKKSSLIFNEAIPNIQMLAQTRDGSRYFHQGCKKENDKDETRNILLKHVFTSL